MTDTPTHDNQAARRAPYRAPTLTVLGAVSELTRNVGKTANADGGKGSKSRSSP